MGALPEDIMVVDIYPPIVTNVDGGLQPLVAVQQSELSTQRYKGARDVSCRGQSAHESGSKEHQLARQFVKGIPSQHL